MDPTAIAFAGILAQLGTSYFQTSPLYLDGQRAWAEWLAWASIALFYQCRNFILGDKKLIDDEKTSFDSPRWSRPSVNRRLSLVVSVLVVASQYLSLSLADVKIQWTLPLITLFTFLFTNYISKTKGQHIGYDNEPCLSWKDYLPSNSKRPENVIPPLAFLGISVTACIALLADSHSLSHTCLLIGVIYLSLMTAAFLFMSKLSCNEADTPLDGQASHNGDVLQSLSIRAFALCTLYLALFSAPVPKLRFLVLAMGTTRVVQLWAIVSLASGNASISASTLATVSAVLNCGVQSDQPAPALLFVLMAIATLIQTCTTLPKSTISKAWIFVLVLLPSMSLVRVTMFGPDNHSNHNWSAISPGRIHPIQQLAKDGTKEFDLMLQRQSKTIEEAVREYRRRYGRSPPPGFDKWFEIAKSKDFQLVDEFDTIMQSLEPYWGVPPSILQARMKSIEDAEYLIKFSVKGDKVDFSSDHYHAAYMMQWVNYTTWGGVLPEVSFMISTLDEPRVVAPYDTIDLAMKSASEQRALQLSKSGHNRPRTIKGGSTKVKWISVGQQDAWEAMLSSCPIDSPARSEGSKTASVEKSLSLPFVGNVTDNKDVCASNDLLHGHGFLASPDSLYITHSLVPVFSQCKPSIFNDVLYPSPYYQMQMESNDYNETEDVPWNEKLDRLYWAGTATGGYASAKNWMNMHRHRLTLMTAPDSTMLVSLLQQDSRGHWQRKQSTWSSLADLFHLKVTRIVQCSAEACDPMAKRFGPLEIEPKAAALGSKYVLDIDGNTFSGRYYRLLKSNAAVLKHTAFNEWHDGRLVPWVHFIPVSAGAEELGEMMRYLTEEDDGQKIGKSIASQGRDWARKTLRKEDLEVVFVRLLMEYARIMNEKRDQLGFDL